MNKNPYQKKELKHFLHTYNRQPLLIKRAKNSYLWDEKGKRYIDFYSGIAVCGVGHTNTKVVKAIQSQAAKLIHASNFFYTNPQSLLAKELTGKYKNSRVFFSNSGAEANELAIKLARLWATKKGKKGREILTFKDSFHGRTLATAAASGSASASKSVFKPLPAGFRSIPFNDLEKVRKAISKNTIAIMIEPIQGEGGIQIASKAFLKGIANLCRKNNLLLILDEIQTGMGRTGTFFAFEQYGIRPDIVTLAKGLAGGLPLGATLAQPSVAKVMVPGYHGSTFGGNPVACAASLEVIKQLPPKALQSIRRSGEYIQEKLAGFVSFPAVKSVRGCGLMLALELKVDGAPHVSLARQRGLLINCTQGKTLRFLPPYFMTKSEINACLRILESVLKDLT